MRMTASVVVLVVSAGCALPRSMMMGQTAAPVGRGAAELSVTGGVQYGQTVTPPSGVAGTRSTNGELYLPAFEANGQYGLTEKLGLNLHASVAGLQPGLKWTPYSSDDLHLALMPQAAFGYVFSHSNTDSGAGTASQSGRFSFLGGLRAMLSHRSGFYAGLGYDVQLLTATTTSPTTTSSDTLTHQLAANVGFDITAGPLRIRPEMAAVVNPVIGSLTSTNVAASSRFAWAIFPGVGFAFIAR